MKYTVLLHCLSSSTTESDLSQMTVEAKDERDAELIARALFERDSEAIVLNTKVLTYSEGDEHNAAILQKAKIEDEKENAPTNLVRTLKGVNYTLSDIGNELREIRVSLPKRNNVTMALSIISATLSLLTATLLLLSLILR